MSVMCCLLSSALSFMLARFSLQLGGLENEKLRFCIITWFQEMHFLGKMTKCHRQLTSMTSREGTVSCWVWTSSFSQLWTQIYHLLLWSSIYLLTHFTKEIVNFASVFKSFAVIWFATLFMASVIYGKVI